jgi:hypothetical protein
MKAEVALSVEREEMQNDSSTFFFFGGWWTPKIQRFDHLFFPENESSCFANFEPKSRTASA